MEVPLSYKSQIPQPFRSGIPSPKKGLSEISSSANNSRNGAMPPPTAFGHKRPGSALTEPATKTRKTLAERAGEPLHTHLAAPRSTTPVSAAVTSAVATSARPQSQLSYSQSYRTNSASSRTTSNSSFASSLGSGLRPPSAQSVSVLARPKTSLAKDRNHNVAATRPATACGQHVQMKEDPTSKRTPPQFAGTVKPRSPSAGLIGAPKTRRPGNSVLNPAREGLAQTSPCRGASLNSAFRGLRLDTPALDAGASILASPTRIPRPGSVAQLKTVRKTTPPVRPVFNPNPFPSSSMKSPRKTPYLTKYSNLGAWDPEEQYGNMERMYEDVCAHYKEAMVDNSSFREANVHYKASISKLEDERSSLTESIISLRAELETAKYRLNAAERDAEDARRDNEEEIEKVRRSFRLEIESIRQAHREETERMRSEQREEIRELKRAYEEELEVERTQRIQAVSQVSTQGLLEKQKQQLELEMKERDILNVKAEIERLNASLDREKALNDDLRQSLATAHNNTYAMESARHALQAKIDYLESDSKSQSEAYASMERKMNEAISTAQECEAKLRKEESLRRKLHNQVQELKGNIRVFCRVRPQHQADQEELAKMTFPDVEDSKDIEVRGLEETSSLGKVTTKSHPFSFDKVFDPASNNAEIFDEISQLIQSALDGYNVCIFAYGQTGSGKTFTMSSVDGMIARAIRQIYSTSKGLEERGWKYSIEGSFIEVYNEEIRDLLGKDHESSTKKHEIRHDMVKCETTITDVTTLCLDSQDQVEGILEQAMARRSVAATKANERSSRSHSVFILKLQGHNSITGEDSKGTLNLVDLAGSERLKESKVEGARLKETQNINKSLACLGDVIGALGQQSSNGGGGGGGGSNFNPKSSVNGAASLDGATAHIPYRNSKLTYLLQFSLGGNSKTLMFVMVAPEKKHLSETLTSLRFAEKVSKTKIGVARKTR